jgi:hypothetical protein
MVVAAFSALLSDVCDGRSHSGSDRRFRRPQLPASARFSETELRTRLEPLLEMYPIAIAELRRAGDPGLKSLEDELVELERDVAATVA